MKRNKIPELYYTRTFEKYFKPKKRKEKKKYVD
jgi:hypothetical protein